MEITFSQKQSRVPVAIMKVQGSVDSSNYQTFTAEARKLIESGAHYLLVNLSECGYMSSAGIRSLNELYLFFRKINPPKGKMERSANLKLLSPSDKLMEVFTISGVDALFEIHTNMETAIASF